MHPRLSTLAAFVLALVAAPAVAQPPAFRLAAPPWDASFLWATSWPQGDLGAGVALADLDGDERCDLVFAPDDGQPLAIFRSTPDGWEDRTADWGPGPVGGAKQVLVVDLDGDGARELLVVGFGTPVRLFTFTGDALEEVDGAGGMQLAIPRLGTGATVADFDGDGDLDVYIAYWKAGPPGPEATNRLYRNDGGLAFTDVTAAAGVGDQRKSYQPVFCDLDDDGWPDLVVAEDKAGGLRHYRNRGDGSFEELTATSGLDGFRSGANALIDGMGIAVGDVDNDGDLDLYATNIQLGNVLYRNDGDNSFAEIAAAAGVLNERFAWGCAFDDVDDDGDLDLYVANFGAALGSQDRLYRGNGAGLVFNDAAVPAGITLAEDGFGLAAGDMDLDGDVDFVLSQGAAPARLWENEGPTGNRATVRVRGAGANRDAIGAVVRARTGAKWQRRDIAAGGSYLSQHPREARFGLGEAEGIDELRIRWPDGSEQGFADVAGGRRYLAVQGVDSLARLDRPLPAPPPGLRLRSATPSAGPFDLELALDAGGRARVELVDLRGRVLRRFELAGEAGAPAALSWDGRDGAGRPVPSGRYWLRAGADVVGVTLLR